MLSLQDMNKTKGRETTHILVFDVPGLFYAKECKCIKHL